MPAKSEYLGRRDAREPGFDGKFVRFDERRIGVRAHIGHAHHYLTSIVHQTYHVSARRKVKNRISDAAARGNIP